MNLTRRGIGGTLFILGFALALIARPAGATIILSVPDPLDGVFAGTRTTSAFASSTNTPARASVDGALASMRLLGSELRFSANINGHCCDNFIASTGRGPQSTTTFAPISVQILGTAGEASGTPVLINLVSGMSGGGVFVSQILNNTSYPLGTSMIRGLEVGDTFSFWPMLNGTDAVSAVLTTSLTVSPATGEPSPVPEPGSFALLTLGVVLGGLLLQRRRLLTIRSFTLAIMCLAAGSARAEMIAVTDTGGHPGISIDTWGWSFTTANTITVTSLGWSDYGNDGLVDPHQIAIWDMSGNLLLSGTVQAGTADPLVSGFRFDSLITGTATLPPGGYVIGGSASLHDDMTLTLEPYGPNGGNGTVTFGQGITYVHTRSGNGFVFPNYVRAEKDWGAFGPNFQYAIGAGPSTAPEPSTMLLGVLASLILFGWKTAISLTVMNRQRARAGEVSSARRYSSRQLDADQD